MNAITQLSAVTIVSLISAGGTFLIKGSPVRTVECDPAALKADEVCLQQISGDETVLWVDARLRKDWAENGLQGSVLWNLDPAEDMQAFEAELVTHLLQSPWVIVYCGDENCGISRQVAERIRALGFGVKVSVLQGGWTALRDGGRIVVK